MVLKPDDTAVLSTLFHILKLRNDHDWLELLWLTGQWKDVIPLGHGSTWIAILHLESKKDQKLEMNVSNVKYHWHYYKCRWEIKVHRVLTGQQTRLHCVRTWLCNAGECVSVFPEWNDTCLEDSCSIWTTPPTWLSRFIAHGTQSAYGHVHTIPLGL